MLPCEASRAILPEGFVLAAWDWGLRSPGWLYLAHTDESKNYFGKPYSQVTCKLLSLRRSLSCRYPSTEGHQQTVFEAQKQDFGSLLSRFLIINLFGPLSLLDPRQICRDVVQSSVLRHWSRLYLARRHGRCHGQKVGGYVGMGCGRWSLRDFGHFMSPFFLGGGLTFGSSQSWDLQLIEWLRIIFLISLG